MIRCFQKSVNTFKYEIAEKLDGPIAQKKRGVDRRSKEFKASK